MTSYFPKARRTLGRKAGVGDERRPPLAAFFLLFFSCEEYKKPSKNLNLSSTYDPKDLWITAAASTTKAPPLLFAKALEVLPHVLLIPPAERTCDIVDDLALTEPSPATPLDATVTRTL